MVALAAGCLESTQPSDSSGPPDAITSNLRLNEIESSGGVPGDWVELFNIGAAPIDLSGYFFRDDNDERTFQIPVGTILAPGAFLVLDEADFGFGLGGADQARLFTPDGVLVDSYTWSNHAATTYGRCPDGTGEFVTTTVPTRGGANNCSSAVVLNEIESSGGDPGTWVELFNASPVAADLSGFIVGDSSDSNTYTLPAGSTIQGRGYLVLDEADLGFALGESDSARLLGIGIIGAARPWGRGERCPRPTA